MRGQELKLVHWWLVGWSCSLACPLLNRTDSISIHLFSPPFHWLPPRALFFLSFFFFLFFLTFFLSLYLFILPLHLIIPLAPFNSSGPPISYQASSLNISIYFFFFFHFIFFFCSRSPFFFFFSLTPATLYYTLIPSFTLITRSAVFFSYYSTIIYSKTTISWGQVLK